MKFNIPLAALLSYLICQNPIYSKSIYVETNNVLEIRLESAKSYENPFRDAKVFFEIKNSEGRVKSYPAFWAGGTIWKLRYSTNSTGSYTYKTICSDESNIGLHNRKGSFQVLEYERDNHLYKFGTLKIGKNQRHLAHLNDEPFLWLADSWWHGMTSRFGFPEDFKVLTKDRKEKGFSVIQFAIGFPCDIDPFDPRGQNEAGDPWDTGFVSINPAYFDLVDERINYLIEEGLLPNIVGAWGYYIKFAGVDNMKLHWEYLLARYSAYPVTWTLCGESTLAFYSDLGDSWEHYRDRFRRDWSEVAEFIQTNDPYDRLLTVHPGPGVLIDGKPPIYDMTQIDFVMLQSGHEGYANLPKATRHFRESYKHYADKPVMHGEVCFEGMHGGGSREKVQRFLFWSNMMMGAPGFSYGVEGIWQFNDIGSPFGKSPGGNNWGNIPWQTAMHYNGSAQLGIGKQILEKFEWWKLRPDNDRIETSEKDETFRAYSAVIEGDLLMVYLPKYPTRWRYVRCVGLDTDKRYKAVYIDPITGDEYGINDVTISDDGKYELPSTPIMQDFVFIISEVN